VPERLHQGLDTDVCVGQFGGEGGPESVHQHPWGALSVEPSLLERPQHPVLQRAPGDPVAIRTDEQRGSGRPGSQPGLPWAFPSRGNRSARESRYCSSTSISACSTGIGRSLLPLPRTWMTPPSSVVRMSPNIGADELVGSQSGQNRGQDNGPVAFGPVGAALRCAVRVKRPEDPGNRVSAKPFGELTSGPSVGRLAASGWSRSTHRCRGTSTTCSRLTNSAGWMRPRGCRRRRRRPSASHA